MNSELENIIRNGFRLSDSNHNDISLITLKIAVKSYFETNRCIRYLEEKEGEGNYENYYYSNYFELYIETIIHFQHFAELVCKKILRNDHALLADEALKKPEILHKLLHNEVLSDEEDREVKSISLSESIKRIKILIKNNILKDSDSLIFILDHIKTIEKLNDLRNRILHRGLYILKDESLDLFIGKYVFPFIIASTANVLISRHDRHWKYCEIYCGIDPIKEIIQAYETDNYDVGKISFLKELGCSAYNNPIKDYQKNVDDWPPTMTTWTKKRAIEIAQYDAKIEGHIIKVCPVCSTNSLVLFTDYYEKSNTKYTFKVKCECCSFSMVNNNIKNASEYGFHQIQDFWFDTE